MGCAGTDVGSRNRETAQLWRRRRVKRRGNERVSLSRREKRAASVNRIVVELWDVGKVLGRLPVPKNDVESRRLQDKKKLHDLRLSTDD